MNTHARLVSVSAAIAPVDSSSDGSDIDPPPASTEAERIALYRLVIEEGPEQGSFVYKTLDSVTGEVIRQFPREEILRLAGAGRYNPGTVIDTVA